MTVQNKLFNSKKNNNIKNNCKKKEKNYKT